MTSVLIASMENSKKDCPICNKTKSRSEKYDAYYCSKCNIWLEPVCGNRNCEFCAARPRNPERTIYADLMKGIQDMGRERQGVFKAKRTRIGRPRKSKKI